MLCLPDTGTYVTFSLSVATFASRLTLSAVYHRFSIRIALDLRYILTTRDHQRRARQTESCEVVWICSTGLSGSASSGRAGSCKSSNFPRVLNSRSTILTSKRYARIDTTNDGKSLMQAQEASKAKTQLARRNRPLQEFELRATKFETP